MLTLTDNGNGTFTEDGGDLVWVRVKAMPGADFQWCYHCALAGENGNPVPVPILDEEFYECLQTCATAHLSCFAVNP